MESEKERLPAGGYLVVLCVYTGFLEVICNLDGQRTHLLALLTAKSRLMVFGCAVGDQVGAKTSPTKRNVPCDSCGCHRHGVCFSEHRFRSTQVYVLFGEFENMLAKKLILEEIMTLLYLKLIRNIHLLIGTEWHGSSAWPIASMHT